MKVFLSHKRQNKNTVKSIKSHLEKAFIKCWLDEEQIEGGAILHQKLINAIDDCDILVAFVCERYLDSAPCIEEFRYAKAINKHIIVYTVGDADTIKNKAKANNISEITEIWEKNIHKPFFE